MAAAAAARPRRPAPCCTQVYHIAARAAVNIARNPLLLNANLAACVILASVVGWLFWDLKTDLPGVISRAGLMFFTLAFFVLTCLVSLSVWNEERLL